MQRLPRPEKDGLRQWQGAWLRSQHFAQDQFIARELLVQDDYRMRQMTWRPATFVDVGAHCGYAALLAKRLWPACNVVCVEPIEENAAVCRRNCPAAEVIVAACTYDPEPIRISVRLAGEHTGGSFVSTNGDRLVRRITLEELLLRAQGDTLLKLDCEGGEFSILEHATCLHLVREIRGEWHNRERFLEIVKRKLPDWKLTAWRDTAIGLFRLERPCV